jgi:hypothetical protein
LLASWLQGLDLLEKSVEVTSFGRWQHDFENFIKCTPSNSTRYLLYKHTTLVTCFG